MKKNLILALLLCIGTTSAMATSNGTYIGIDLGQTRILWDVSDSTGQNSSGSDSQSSQTLKVGYYFNQQNRASVFYQHINVDDATFYMTGAMYDYLIGTYKLKPFVGAILGYGSLESDYGDHINGVVYGAQIGLNYSFNEHFSAETGYRYLKSNMEESYTDSDYTGNITSANINLDPLLNWFIGINYKF